MNETNPGMNRKTLALLAALAASGAFAEPFPAEMLVGTWKMSKTYVSESRTRGLNVASKISGRISTTLSFLGDGKCRITSIQTTADSVGHPMSFTYRYEYDAGNLELTGVVGFKDGDVKPIPPCLNASRFELRRIDNETFELKYGDVSQYDEFSRFMNIVSRSKYLADGTLEVVQERAIAKGLTNDTVIRHPTMVFRRVKDLSPEKQVKEGSPIYRIASFAHEDENDFAYRFKLELLDREGNKLKSFRRVKQEFEVALKEEIAKTFDGDFSSLFVEIPEFRLQGDLVWGTAVALRMTPLSLSYSPVTRRGKMSISLVANQFDIARQLIRKNIESLARSSNIAVREGEIPPAARFYLGREQVRDGNVLEIEFMTE